MSERQLEALMWAQACAAMERAERLHRQFFHRRHTAPNWEAPCDIFETEAALTIVIALPGVEVDQIKVVMSAGVLSSTGDARCPTRRPMPESTAWRSPTAILNAASNCRRRGSRFPAGIWPMAA